MPVRECCEPDAPTWQPVLVVVDALDIVIGALENGLDVELVIIEPAGLSSLMPTSD